MADNVTANAGAGGETFAADDIGGVKFPRTKLIIGADGTNDGDVASGNPLPVTGTVTSLIPGTGATNLGKAVDSAVGATDTGVAPQTVKAVTKIIQNYPDWDDLEQQIAILSNRNELTAKRVREWIRDVEDDDDTLILLMLI